MDVGQRRIEYSVVRGRSRRYTYFRFKPDATLEIAVPRLRSFEAEAVIRERSKWILKHYDQLTTREQVLADDSVMFDGRRLRMDFQKTSGEEGLVPDPAGGRVIVKAAERPRLRELVRRWFLKESSGYVVRPSGGASKGLGTKYTPRIWAKAQRSMLVIHVFQGGRPRHCFGAGPLGSVNTMIASSGKLNHLLTHPFQSPSLAPWTLITCDWSSFSVSHTNPQ